MVATVAGIHGGLDIHANRPAGNAVPDGSLYSCSTHGLIYKSNYAGNSWATYATLGAAASGSITASGYTQSTARLLGRTTASTGAIEEITVGSGLSLSAGSLTATGGSSGAQALPIDAAAAAAVGSGDLFSGTSLDGGWASLQSTALASSDRAQDNWLIANIAGSTSGQDRGLKRTFAPAGDFTVYAKLGFIGPLTGNYLWAGIFVGDTTASDTGNRLDLHLLYNGGLHLKFAKELVGAETTIFDNALSSLGNAAALPNTNLIYWPVWLRIERVGTTLTAGISWDGVAFIDQGTTTTIAFTVGKIGIEIGQNSSTNAAVASYNYIATTG